MSGQVMRLRQLSKPIAASSSCPSGRGRSRLGADLGGREVLLEQLRPGMRIRLFVEATLIGYGVRRGRPSRLGVGLEARPAPAAYAMVGPFAVDWGRRGRTARACLTFAFGNPGRSAGRSSRRPPMQCHDPTVCRDLASDTVVAPAPGYGLATSQLGSSRSTEWTAAGHPSSTFACAVAGPASRHRSGPIVGPAGRMAPWICEHLRPSSPVAPPVSARYRRRLRRTGRHCHRPRPAGGIENAAAVEGCPCRGRCHRRGPRSAAAVDRATDH